MTVSGKLKSSDPFCYRKQRVKLIRFGGGLVATTTTANDGSYRFRHKVSKTVRWQASYDGKVTGVHPNTKTCRASVSGPITVRVG